MTPAEKLDSFTALRKQANDKIYELFSKSGHEADKEITTLVDLKNKNGQGGIVEVQPKTKSFTDINVDSKDLDKLKDKPDLMNKIDKSKLSDNTEGTIFSQSRSEASSAMAGMLQASSDDATTFPQASITVEESEEDQIPAVLT